MADVREGQPQPPPPLSAAARVLIGELERAQRMQMAAWKRYLTAIDLVAHTSSDNDIRGRRPVNRAPPV